MGDLSGLEEMNDTCGKTTHMGTMNKGFTVYKMYLKEQTLSNTAMKLLIS